MGGTCTKPLAQYDKKVLIVGASFSGMAIAERLWDQFEVTIIDKNDYFEYSCTGSKSLVENEHLDHTTSNYSLLFRAHHNKA